MTKTLAAVTATLILLVLAVSNAGALGEPSEKRGRRQSPSSYSRSPAGRLIEIGRR